MNAVSAVVTQCCAVVERILKMDLIVCVDLVLIDLVCVCVLCELMLRVCLMFIRLHSRHRLHSHSQLGLL